MKSSPSFKIEFTGAVLLSVVSLFVHLSWSESSHAAAQGFGLVWKGAGACNDGCWQAAGKMVRAAGLQVRYLDEKTPASTSAEIVRIFSGARVWVMPGGYAAQELEGMSGLLRNGLRRFVSQGGGYVGWCAGAYAATAAIGDLREQGLGIFPGNTEDQETNSPKNKSGASIEQLTWHGETRHFYLEGGPHLANLPSNVEVIATFNDHHKSVAAARVAYGSGRVFISGVHPEAPLRWWANPPLSIPMVLTRRTPLKWSAGLQDLSDQFSDGDCLCRRHSTSNSHWSPYLKKALN